MKILTREPQGVRRSEGSIWKALGKLYSMLIYIVIHYLIKINILEVFLKFGLWVQIDNYNCLSSDRKNRKGLRRKINLPNSQSHATLISISLVHGNRVVQ